MAQETRISTSSRFSALILGMTALAPFAVAPATADTKNAKAPDSAAKSFEGFSLAAYVPGDAWLYIHERNTQEREFISAYEEKVLKALLDSGIVNEIRDLIVSEFPDDAQRADFENKWRIMSDAIMDVPWKSLGAGEFVYTQRMEPMVPKHIMLFSIDPASADTARAKLVNLLETVGTLANVAMVNETRGSVNVWSVPFFDGVFSMEVFQRDGVIGVSTARAGTDKVIELMDGRNAGDAILAQKDVADALATLPAPEDGIYVFRVATFFTQIKEFVTTAINQAQQRHQPGQQHADNGKESESDRVKRIIFRAIDELDFIKTAATTRRTEGLQEILVSRIGLKEDFASKPIARAFTQRKQFDQFDKFVPKEAKNFNVWTGVDLALIYDTVIDFIRKEIPDGPAALQKWEQSQIDVGFNVKNDCLSWISGELIGVTMPGNMPMQDNFVLMLRLSDPKAASEKINGWLDKLANLGQEHQVMVNACPEVDVEGFRSVFHPMMMMMQMKPIVGVHDDWLIIASAPQALNKCLATAKGDHPSIRANERFQTEGLMPDGQVCSTSFTDLTNLGQELAMGFGMMGMASSFMPDVEETKPIKTIFTMMARLAPVMAEIDFLSSSAGASRFTGTAWESKVVVTYKPVELTNAK